MHGIMDDTGSANIKSMIRFLRIRIYSGKEEEDFSSSPSPIKLSHY
jgi:hypothetical protein